MKSLALLIIGFLLGFSSGLSSNADAVPGDHKNDANCRGNGAGGYRACRINLNGPANKVALNVYIDGEYDFGIVYRTYDNGETWKKVTP